MATSKSIQHTARLWTEEGETTVGLVATVAPILRFNKNYSYAVPQELATDVELGKRVMIPIGKKGRLIEGFVLDLDRREWDSTLRPIDSIIDTHSFLTQDLIDLAREISEHYRCPLGQTLKAMTPQAVRAEAGLKKVRYVRLARTIEEIEQQSSRISKQRRAVLDRLGKSDGWESLETVQKETSGSATIIRTMQRDGWVQVETRKQLPDTPEEQNQVTDPDFELNDQQKDALVELTRAIESKTFSANLLFGVSGSGKTEVYVHAMRDVIARGKQAIMLVPEIVLTTQLVQRLSMRFTRVAVVHSGLTGVQRSLMWRAIAAGKKDVIIGTRSAVFAPCPNLGLICVDEEQETSYKNLQAPRFHVRDVAIIRASKLKIPVVLGSATPSLETWYNSEHKPNYRRLTIANRVKDLPMPKVHVVDMEQEQAEIKAQLSLSRVMEQLLTQTLERKEQALVLVNRRGFARQLFCPACRTTHRCPNCDIPFVVHASTGRVVCHYCRASEKTPTHCQSVSCGEKLEQSGQGTQRIEWILNEMFPDARVSRVDSDTMTHRRHYEEIVTRFTNREIDILVGTQMIAKGLDFPFVSFVGMIDADAGAIGSDFRAHERLFQLVTQVAGRAGRADATGRVVVQTKNPNLPAFTHALAHDYVAFVEEEIAARKKSHWPPFRRIARIVLAHQREQTAEQEASALSGRIEEAIVELKLDYADVLPAAPCALSRIKGRYRYDVIIRTHTASDLRKLLTHLESKKALPTKAQSQILDVDPVSMT
jgi:primosomal protein N' (replication factor Y) (superfamily II helicase)